ncbi:MAG: VanZ family protein [Candidatus Hatepunaea meridiana]|nr:VanZ family protein [Candidatus Hatepunaea meridiana]
MYPSQSFTEQFEVFISWLSTDLISIGDVFLHGVVFILLGAILTILMGVKRPLLLVWIICFLFGIAEEARQAYIGRPVGWNDLQDLFVNGVFALVGIFTVAKIRARNLTTYLSTRKWKKRRVALVITLTLVWLVFLMLVLLINPSKCNVNIYTDPPTANILIDGEGPYKRCISKSVYRNELTTILITWEDDITQTYVIQVKSDTTITITR